MDEPGEMRVVAAAFPDFREATSAASELLDRLDLAGADMAIAPAGGDPARTGFRAFLAGRFRRRVRPLVDEVIRRHDGRVVEDLPEAKVTRGMRTTSAPGTSRRLVRTPQP